MESATETEIGTASRGAMVVAVAAAAGDGGLEGLQVMHMHLEIGRWRKEWDFNQTLIFMTLHLWTFKNMVLFWFIIVYLLYPYLFQSLLLHYYAQIDHDWYYLNFPSLCYAVFCSIQVSCTTVGRGAPTHRAMS
jgi:hypothetical protein